MEGNNITIEDIQKIADAKKRGMQAIVYAAKDLNDLMKDFDPYSYNEDDYNLMQAYDDIVNNPGFVVRELVRMVRDLM